jgi:hypothetical protein
MFDHALRPDKARERHHPRLRGGTTALALTMISLGVNAVLLIYEVGYLRGWSALYSSAEHYDSPHGGWPYSLVALRLGFVAALAVGGAGLWSHSFRGFVGSLVSWMFVGAEYAWWYYDSQRLLSKLEIVDYSQLHIQGLSHAAGLHHATWWDVIFLTQTALLLFWHFWNLKALRRPKKLLL